MGFFSSRPMVARVEPGWSALPEWYGPPPGVLPGYVPTRAVVFRTPRALLIAGRFDAYPSGVAFTLDLHLRDADDDEPHWFPWELPPPRGRRPPAQPEPLPDEFLRLGLVFADGSSWSNLDHPFAEADETPKPPVVIGQGGGGGGGSWRADQWMWPLPPAGPLTFVAEWPKYSIGESRATIDAGELREAATRAEVLWPPDT